MLKQVQHDLSCCAEMLKRPFDRLRAWFSMAWAAEWAGLNALLPL